MKEPQPQPSINQPEEDKREMVKQIKGRQVMYDENVL